MAVVKIVVQEGFPGLGPSTEIVVRRPTTVAALAVALAAVMPQLRLEWADLIRTARTLAAAVKAAREDAGETEVPPWKAAGFDSPDAYQAAERAGVLAQGVQVSRRPGPFEALAGLAASLERASTRAAARPSSATPPPAEQPQPAEPAPVSPPLQDGPGPERSGAS